MVGGGGQSTAAPSFFDCIRDSLLKSVVSFLFGNAWPIKGCSARSVRVNIGLRSTPPKPQIRCTSWKGTIFYLYRGTVVQYRFRPLSNSEEGTAES